MLLKIIRCSNFLVSLFYVFIELFNLVQLIQPKLLNVRTLTDDFIDHFSL